MDETFTVTKQWITTHSTANGGLKRAQLEQIGVAWPPQPGWKERAAGTRISLAAKARFEQIAANTKAKK